MIFIRLKGWMLPLFQIEKLDSKIRPPFSVCATTNFYDFYHDVFIVEHKSLIAKRKRKRESMKQHPMLASLATLHEKLKKMEQRQPQDWFQPPAHNMRALTRDGNTGKPFNHNLV